MEASVHLEVRHQMHKDVAVCIYAYNKYLDSGKHSQGCKAEGHEVCHAKLGKQLCSPSMHSRHHLHCQAARCHDSLHHQYASLLAWHLQLVCTADKSMRHIAGMAGDT